jgi:DeoR/GlpR family transcriptional regulator of sugar metabolism
MAGTVDRILGDGGQLTAVRQKNLLDAVQDRGAMSVRDICDYLGVSEATVRRDVTALHQKGLLARTHGGVVANSIVKHDISDSDRLKLNEPEKARIGEAAINLLHGGETVLIDAGTTGLAVAMNAHKRPDCTFATTSLGAAQILKESGIENFHMIGGSYVAVNDSFGGALAASMIRSLSFDVAFLCVTAVDIHRRAISLGNESYAQVQREIVTSARKKYVVADNSKFKASAFLLTAGFDDLSGIISNAPLDDDVKAFLSNEELELILT